MTQNFYRFIYRHWHYKQLLLRKKAAEELKKEQERKAAERRRIIEERCGKPKNIEDANEGKTHLSMFLTQLRHILFYKIIYCPNSKVCRHPLRSYYHTHHNTEGRCPSYQCE